MIQLASAREPGNAHFQRTWERPDLPVSAGQANRTWMWGPEAFTDPLDEAYAESPGGERTVQYFDKSRMEITNPDGNPGSDWYVTNGLLAVELTTGRLQAGDDTFVQFPPSTANVAGDQDDPAGVSYRLMGALRNAPALIEGLPVILRLAPDGTISIDPTLLLHQVTAAKRVTAPGLDHIVASPFWLFMNSPGMVYLDGEFQAAPLFPDPFYATGLPITEAYWVNVKVGGEPKDVLMQCFERRCLTYTPGNPEGWQVEAGNVGQHYYKWRYEEIPGLEDPDQEPEPVPSESPGDVEQVPTETPDDEATPPPAETPSEPDPVPTETPAEPAPEPEPEPTQPPVTEYQSVGDIGGRLGDYETFVEPDSISVTPDGNLAIIDRATSKWHIYTPNGEWLETHGGSDDYFVGASDIEVDQNGDTWILNTQRHSFVKLDRNGTATLVIGRQGSGEGEFVKPLGMGFGPDGNLYIADTGNDRIQVFDPDGRFIRQWGETGSGDGQLNDPYDLDFDKAGNVYVTDFSNHRVQVFSSTGAFLKKFGDRPGTTVGRFEGPRGIAVTANGGFYVADSFNNRIQRFNAQGRYAFSIGSPGPNAGEFQLPNRLLVYGDSIYVTDGQQAGNYIHRFSLSGIFRDRWNDDTHNRFANDFQSILTAERGLNDEIWVVDQALERVVHLDRDGKYMSEYRGLSDRIVGLTVDDDGTVFVSGKNVIYVINPDGTLSQLEGLPTNLGHMDIAGDRLYVTVYGEDQVLVLDKKSGAILKTIDNSGTGPGQFQNPWGLEIHGDRVFVTDSYNNRVQVLDLDGNYLYEFGNGPVVREQLLKPRGLDVSPDGYVFVADTEKYRIVKYDLEGNYITEIAYENGLVRPYDVSIDSTGQVTVGDTGNARLALFRGVKILN